MPSEDVSDLRDVVDAINKLCDTMKTSSYDDDTFEDCSQTGSVDLVDLSLYVANEEVVPEEAVLAEVEHDPDWYVTCRVETPESDGVIFKKIEHYNTETWRQSVSRLEIAFPEDVVVHKTETYTAERWSDPPVSAETHKDETQTDRWSDPTSRLEIVSPEDSVQKTETERWSDPPIRSQEAHKVVTQTDRWSDPSSRLEIVSPEDSVQKTETERWSDSSVSLPGQVEEETVASDEPAQAQCEQFSEMYYTASSEVSLLSDLEGADKGQEEEPRESLDKDDRKEYVIAGHVAAMRERFESMTRTNTPCPDLIRSISPTRDVFRNITPSPDHLG